MKLMDLRESSSRIDGFIFRENGKFLTIEKDLPTERKPIGILEKTATGWKINRIAYDANEPKLNSMEEKIVFSAIFSDKVEASIFLNLMRRSGRLRKEAIEKAKERQSQ